MQACAVHLCHRSPDAVALFGTLLHGDGSVRCIRPCGMPAAVRAPAPLRFQK